jgi:hypothetical protein
MPVTHRSLLAAIRERMRHRARANETQEKDAGTVPSRTVDRPPRPAAVDHELEQIAAEARYHRDRFELYRARVISGSPAATSSGRLRELESTATAAQERLRHARRVRSSASEALE